MVLRARAVSQTASVCTLSRHAPVSSPPPLRLPLSLGCRRCPLRCPLQGCCRRCGGAAPTGTAAATAWGVRAAPKLLPVQPAPRSEPRGQPMTCASPAAVHLAALRSVPALWRAPAAAAAAVAARDLSRQHRCCCCRSWLAPQLRARAAAAAVQEPAAPAAAPAAAVAAVALQSSAVPHPAAAAAGPACRGAAWLRSSPLRLCCRCHCHRCWRVRCLRAGRPPARAAQAAHQALRLQPPLGLQ
jgi:hypothetical protein